MSALKKIDSIMFRVKDLAMSAKFYVEELGMKQVWQDDENNMIGLIFPESDSEIVLHSNKEIPSPDFSFLVDNVEVFVKDFIGKGYKLVNRPIHVRSGKFTTLSDLDGNLIPIIDLTKFGNKPRYDKYF